MPRETHEPTLRKPLRLWPGVAAAVLILLARFVIPTGVPGAILLAVIGPVVGGLVIVMWWMFLSRALWSERLSALALMIVAAIATSRIVHESIATGMMGMMFPIFALPVLSLALVAWAVASRRLSGGPRRASMVATLLLACGFLTLLRTGGLTGAGNSDLHWRWTPTPEQRLLARGGDEPAPPPSAPKAAETPQNRLPGQASDEPPAASPPSVAETSEKRMTDLPRHEPTTRSAGPTAVKTDAEWPGFRGPARDGTVRGVRIATDWAASPPVQLWRRPIGPGWSSFAVSGDTLYTQEQRGDDEVVSSYKVTTGQPIWRHRDAVRFWESNGGAGPRATPTLSNGRVYTLGATGIMNALDDGTGAVVWSRNAVSDTGAKIPGWGISGSPLVVGDVVIVAASGTLVAYDLATGKPRWFGPRSGTGYSSPQLLTIDGVAQILLMSSTGATSVALADGKLLWNYSWPSDTRIMQPAVIADGDLMISVGDGMGGGGMRRIAVKQGSSGWTIEERWTSEDMNANFNDFVIHKGHAFGFDYGTVACIDLKDGKRKWKGARHGYGQLLLLPDQDVLLLVSEKGELALVKATPDQFTELARFPAIEGKTWNHPALAGDVLLVRNDHEMAAFRLSLTNR
jgi:outer membrane protein assembly factor BamB